jgi:hypothetical protein
MSHDRHRFVSDCSLPFELDLLQALKDVTLALVKGLVFPLLLKQCYIYLSIGDAFEFQQVACPNLQPCLDQLDYEFWHMGRVHTFVVDNIVALDMPNIMQHNDLLGECPSGKSTA